MLRLWPDNPSPVDLLGFADIAEPIIEAVGRERLDPVAIGVFGDWGSGKTTVLEIISDRLSAREDTIVVFTRPWEYDPTLDARGTLIGEVLDALRAYATADAEFWERTKDRFRSLAKRVRWSKALTLAARAALTLTVPSADELTGIFGEDEASADPTLQGFREEFASLMTEFTSVTRVVVLVDDLDRCLPDTVVTTLDAIKLFLSVPKMAFVVAADEAPIRAAIARHFDASQQGSRMAGDYLEKIIQIPVNVPALGESDTEAYLALMLLDEHLHGDETQLTAIAKHCAERRKTGVADVLSEMPAGLIPGAAGPDMALAAELARVLYEKLAGNPRRLKRFLNAFWLRSAIAASRGITLSPNVLAKLMVLERVEEDAFGQLIAWTGTGEIGANLEKVENGEQLADARGAATFAWWGKMPPKLAGEDIAPYLRLAATLRRRPGPRTGLRTELAELVESLGSDATAQRQQALQRLRDLTESDRRDVAREIGATLRGDSSRQVAFSEALAELASEETAAADVAEGLGQLDSSRVEAALILALGGGDSVPAPVLGLIRRWQESGRLNEIAQNAAAEVLGAAG